MDRVVTSKVSLRHWASIPALIAIFSFFAYLFITNNGVDYDEGNPFKMNRELFFSISTIVILVSIWGFFFRPEKITISAYGILMHGNIIKRQRVITRGDVEKLYVLRHNRSISGAVGYSSTTLCLDLKNGKTEGINETGYENYESLKSGVYEYFRDTDIHNETAL